MSGPEFNALPPDLEERMKAKRAEARQRRRASETDADPQAFGPYRLLEEIGEGPGGKVWSAQSPDGQDVVVKLLRRSVVRGVEEPGTRARVASVRIAPLVGVDHPHRVRVLAVAEHDNQHGIVMARVDSSTLDHRIREVGYLPYPVALRMVAEAADAVSALHAAGVVHGDIKARNVFVDAQGAVLISEPGTAEDAHGGADDRALALSGSPVTFAPERFAGHPVDSATDVYALGVLAFQLLSRRLPVKGPLVKDLREAHATGKLLRLGELCPDLPPQAVTAVESALAADAEQRPSASALSAALSEAAAIPPELARRERATGLARWWWERPAWQRRGLVGVGVAVLFALLVLRSA